MEKAVPEVWLGFLEKPTNKLCTRSLYFPSFIGGVPVSVHSLCILAFTYKVICILCKYVLFLTFLILMFKNRLSYVKKHSFQR